ncbi:MAG: acyl-homoserine lactone acylase PvdQ [Candidatus Azotimanducaceae bacterium]|jgi:acyl-homoserine lactone acylase PvdQ
MNKHFKLWGGFALLTTIFVTSCSNAPEQAASKAGAANGVSVGANQLPSKELERLKAIAAQVKIIRDDYGVPHIYGKTDADAVFGLLYAQAEDDFNRVERNYIWATGRLAEVEGEDALFSDLRARLYMTTDEAIAAYNESPDWLKALCDAYADGLNYYLATHPEVRPKLLTKFEPWMPMFFSEGSIGGDIEQVPLAGIRTFYGSQKPLKKQLLSSNTTSNSHFDLKEPRGSNGFAIAGELTESGNAMLLINPHTSFYFRGEVHVVSEEGLNAYGAVTWGQFFVYQGFNENTGWMHTSTRLDFMDEFVEQVEQRNGKLMYLYGEEWRPVEVSKVTLKYKDGDKQSLRSFPMYHTHHGPITHTIDDKWVATKLNWDPVNALQQSYIRSKQTGHKGFREMMDIRTNSSNNTVYADSEGNIAYYHGNFVPRRNVAYDFSQPVDGSNPETDWQGVHTVDEIVTILNPKNGWIQNCNSTPFTAAAEFSPVRENYPVYMAPDPENFRGLHAVKVLTGQKDLTLDKLIDLAYDPYLPGFEKLISGLIKAYDNNKKQGQTAGAAVEEAIEILRQWDKKVSADSVAMTIAHHYGMQFGEDGANPRNLSRAELIDYFGTDSPEAERLSVFKNTLSNLEQDFGGWKISWGEVNRFQRLTGDIQQPHDDDAPSTAVGMASSRWGALASFGAKRYPGTKKIYGTAGNSFVAVVEFGKKVKAKTLLAGGQSGDPSSPHFDDQAQRYVDGQFKDVAYYKEDVIARAKETYAPGMRR